MSYDSREQSVSFIFLLAFFLMGFAVCLISIISVGKEFKTLEYPEMPAIVVNQDVVVFEDEAGKQYFLYVSTEGYSFGDKVMVKYNPDDINDAFIGGNSFGGLILGLVFSMLIGVAFMIVSLFLAKPIFIEYKNRKREFALGKAEK